MKITMVQGLSGPDYSLSPGDEHDCDADEAARLIEGGVAVPFAETVIETSVKKNPRKEKRG